MTIDRDALKRLRIEALDRKRHDRAPFSCGVARVDNFLKTSVGGQQDVDVTRCYVACFDALDVVAGFYAMNAHAIDASTLPEEMQRKLPRYDALPAIYLSVVGVDERHQGIGMGSYLLGDAFKRCIDVSDRLGTAFIVLDALNDRAAKLYRRLGFVDLPGHESRMAIGMRRVRAACAQVSAPAQA